MNTKDPFFLLLEKVFIENQFPQQKWFCEAKSYDELVDAIKQNLAFRLICLQRNITDEDIRNLLRTSVSYMAHYAAPKVAKRLIAKKKFLPFSVKIAASGEIKHYDMAKFPHLACSDSREIVASLIREKTPKEMKLVIMCSESKMEKYGIFLGVETQYLAIMRGGEYGPSLISTCTAAENMLNSLMCESQRRLDLLEQNGFYSIEQYNAFAISPEFFIPYIVVVMDDFADFITQAGRHIEKPIVYLARGAERAGIHILLSTTRPSNDVLTGVIKSEIPKYLRMSYTMNDAEIQAIVEEKVNPKYTGEQYTLPFCKITHIHKKII